MKAETATPLQELLDIPAGYTMSTYLAYLQRQDEEIKAKKKREEDAKLDAAVEARMQSILAAKDAEIARQKAQISQLTQTLSEKTTYADYQKKLAAKLQIENNVLGE